MGSVTSVEPGNVRVFRVEGKINERIVIGDNGEVAIIGKNKTLFLNFGQIGRANDFLAKRLGQGMKDSSIKSFEVSQSFLDKIRSEAIRERDVKKFPPGRPLRVDVKKADDQFALRSNQIEELEKEIVEDSGKVYHGPIEGGE